MTFIVPSSANYTEFLRDYIENGNTLPSILAEVDTAFDCNFTEVFTNHFYMREIGFESEELFKHHLSAKANIIIPFYKSKAEKLNSLFTEIFEEGYTITQTNNLTNTVTNEVTSNVNIEYNTPAGSTEKVLDASAISGGNENTNTRNGTNTNAGTITTDYSKNPRFNSLEALEKFQNDFKNIIQECLNAFDNLFMQVY